MTVGKMTVYYYYEPFRI